MNVDRARDIFVELIAEVSPDQWDTRLAEMAGDDHGLHAKVAELLAAHQRADSFLEQPASPTLGATSDAAELVGLVLADRYKLLELIGDGGMGSVWMAQQIEPVKRLVAVKLIRPSIDNKQVLARFEAERQALALMEHPNIARILDAGEAPDGRSFFVMELVKGISITRYCDERQLTLRQRLELFVPVCEAIQHAHHKGVIHRDIKPSNVLIAQFDDRPVPKVIDFGVATATGQPLTEHTLHTTFGMVVGTAEYMSPEQASFNQLDVDTRSDIYSLGVLLYELLAGSPPFGRNELERAGLLEMLKVIREREPERPSTRLSTSNNLPALAVDRGSEPKALTNVLRGELDWVVMKTLEKQRNARYASASELAADIERFLNGEPVTARPPTAAYRLQKFVHKHKAPVAATASVVAAIVALGGLAIWQGTQAQKQAQIVRAQSILTSAAAANDSLLKAQLLLETDTSLTGWLSVARDAASQPLPIAVLRGHDWNITTAAFLPDGKHVFTASRDGVARIWPVDGRTEPVVLKGEHYRLWALSPDGRFAANAVSAGIELGPKDAHAYVWRTDEPGDPLPLAGQEPNSDGTFSVAFSPDSQNVVVGGRDGAVRLWRVDGTELPLTLRVRETIEALRFSRDGTRLLGAADGTVYIWSIGASDEPVVLNGVPMLREYQTSATFSPDGTRVATVSGDATARIWRPDGTGEPLILRGHDDSIYSVDFSADGRRLVTGSADRTARIWQLNGPSSPIILRGHQGAVTTVLFSPNGDWVASGSADGTARLWPADGEGRPVVLNGHEAPVTHIAFSPDGSLLLTASADTTARVWSLNALGEVHVLPAIVGERQRRSILASPVLAFSPDSTHLLTSWETASNARIRSLRDENDSVELPGRAAAATFTPDGSRVLTVADDLTVRAWPRDGMGQPVVLMPGPDEDLDRLRGIALSRDGTQLAVALRGGTTRMWDTESAQARTLPGSTSISPLSFSNDGRHLAGASLNGFAAAWDLDASTEPVIFQGHLDEVVSVEFSRDGSRVVSGSSDATARVWRAEDAVEIAVFPADNRWVNTASFSPDGQHVVTGGEDGVVRVFSLDDSAEPMSLVTGEEPPVFVSDSLEVVRVAFTPDGKRVAAALVNGQINVWRVTTDGLLDYLRSHVNASLTPAQRMKFLGESEDEAWTGYIEDEQSLGRQPQVRRTD